MQPARCSPNAQPAGSGLLEDRGVRTRERSPCALHVRRVDAPVEDFDVLAVGPAVLRHDDFVVAVDDPQIEGKPRKWPQ